MDPLRPTPELLQQRKLHRLPQAIYSDPMYEFFFTICARHQGTPFLREEVATLTVESLLWTRKRYAWKLFCFCLMPDHLHIVCKLTEREARSLNAGARGIIPEGVLEHLGRFKSYTTTRSW